MQQIVMHSNVSEESEEKQEEILKFISFVSTSLREKQLRDKVESAYIQAEIS